MNRNPWRFVLSSAVGSLVFLPVVAQAADWAQFRGPTGGVISQPLNLPQNWEKEAIAWKVELPGRGASSPIIVGDRVIVTCFSGYGCDPDRPGGEEDLRRHVLCFDLSTGNRLWQADVPAVLPESDISGFLKEHGFAASTPASDGEHLFVFFGKSGVFCYTLTGNQVWHAEVGSGFSAWGSGASLTVWRDFVFVNASLERQTLYALDKRTGEPVWKLRKILSSWSTPVIVELPDGNNELVLNIHRRVLGIDPETGLELWRCEKSNPDESFAAPTPAVRDGIIYASDGRLFAVRAGGRGDVTDTHVLWRSTEIGSNISSPLLVGDAVFSLGEGGVYGAANAASGERLVRARLTGSPQFYASPVAAGDRFFVPARRSGIYVLDRGPEFGEIANQKFPADESLFNATAAISAGRLLIRSDKFLYCLGTQ